ncbi:MAG: tRNA (adenosine(37)-N6)-threonylcarbamoyltransferase complex dimerization subunit type 1 TsaB [Actinomycetota bacterium]
MLVLGIETATPQVGVAIGGHEGVLASFHSARDRRHAETLAPAIRFVSEQARVDLEEIGVLAVDVGPGLFTGMRVGLATAKALAHALRVPMVPVSSLDLVAFPVRYCSRRIVAVIDARRGEVFHAAYRQVPGGIQRLTEPVVCTPDELAGDLVAVSEDALLVGDGAIRYADVLSRPVGVEIGERGLQYPSAQSLVQLAHAAALREAFVQPREVEAVYLRQPDAIANWRSRERES